MNPTVSDLARIAEATTPSPNADPQAPTAAITGADLHRGQPADAAAPTAVQRITRRLLADGLDLYGDQVDFDLARNRYLDEMRLPDADPGARVAVLTTALDWLTQLVVRHRVDGDCDALSAEELAPLIRVFVCDCFADRRDVARIARYGSWPTRHQFQTCLADPDYWLPIVIMSAAAALWHSARPHDVLCTLAA